MSNLHPVRSFLGPRALAVAAAGTLLAATPAVAKASAIGPAAARCNANDTAVLVDVSGFKARTGTLRVQIYDANPKTFLEKGKYLERVEVPASRAANASGICLPVERPGRYVVSVRHDINGNGKSDRSDGGGMSGNPDTSLGDLIFKRKPSLARVSFAVGGATQRVPVVLNYLNGTSFEPVGR